MKPWEFILSCKNDLEPFADLLEEWNHPGAAIVRELIDKNKFPQFASRHSDERRWLWCTGLYLDQTWGLPSLTLANIDETRDTAESRQISVSYYFSLTEAIWAVINVRIYPPSGLV